MVINFALIFPSLFWGYSLFLPSPCKEFLDLLSGFPFFSTDFGGSVGIKNYYFLVVVFLPSFHKKMGRCERVLRFMGREVQGR